MLIDACTDVLMLIRMDKSHQVCAISFEWLCHCVIVGVHAKKYGGRGGGGLAEISKDEGARA